MDGVRSEPRDGLEQIGAQAWSQSLRSSTSRPSSSAGSRPGSPRKEARRPQTAMPASDMLAKGIAPPRPTKVCVYSPAVAYRVW